MPIQSRGTKAFMGAKSYGVAASEGSYVGFNSRPPAARDTSEISEGDMYANESPTTSIMMALLKDALGNIKALSSFDPTKMTITYNAVKQATYKVMLANADWNWVYSDARGGGEYISFIDVCEYLDLDPSAFRNRLTLENGYPTKADINCKWIILTRIIKRDRRARHPKRNRRKAL